MNYLTRFARRYREFSIFLLDAFCILLAYLLGYIFRFIDHPGQAARYMPHFMMMIKTFPAVLLLYFLFAKLFRIDQALWKYTSIYEVGRIGFVAIITNLIWFLIVYYLPVIPYVRSVPILAGIFQVVLMLGLRFLYRFFRNREIRSSKHKNALIIGAGSAGALLYDDIMTNDHYDANVLGFVDDNPTLKGMRISGLQVLGSVNDLKDIIRDRDIDIVYIAIPSASKKRIAEIIDTCSQLSLRTQIMDYRVKENLEEISSLREVSVEDLLGRDEVKLDVSSISGYLQGRTVLVTGGGGSIGSELCRQVLKYKPAELIVMDIYENNMYDLQQELMIRNRRTHEYDGIKMLFLIGSVRDKKRLQEVFDAQHIDAVFHAAAHKHVPLVEDSPKEAVKNNVFGTLNTLQAAIAHKADRFILISTDKAVNPTNAMGATKRMTELIVQALKNNGVTKVAAVRFGNVLGSNGSVIPLFREEILAGGPVTVTDPEIERYFMTIPEAASLVLQAGVYAGEGDIFVLDMGTRVKILKLAENMITLSGYRPYEDIDIEFIGLRPGEKMYEEISLGNEKRYKTANDRVFVNEPMNIDADQFFRELEQLWNDLEVLDGKEISDELFRLIEKYK